MGSGGGGGDVAALGGAADAHLTLKNRVIEDSYDPSPCFSLPPDPNVLLVFTLMNDGLVGSFQEIWDLHFGGYSFRGQVLRFELPCLPSRYSMVSSQKGT